MKKRNSPHQDAALREDHLREEYDESVLRGGARGKYVERYRSGTNLVLLAPDVAAVFRDDEAVNAALRSLIQAKGKVPP
jgi:hypothetical protein